MLTLDKAKKGDVVKILTIPDERVRAQAIRFGIAENQTAKVVEIVPGGPTIIEKGKQEIAIGRNLSKTIAVELISSGQNLFKQNKYKQVI